MFHSLLNGEVEAVYCCPANLLKGVQDELRKTLPVETVLVGGHAPEGKNKSFTYLKCFETRAHL